MTSTFMAQAPFKPIICVTGYENRTKDKEHYNRLQGTFSPPTQCPDTTVEFRTTCVWFAMGRWMMLPAWPCTPVGIGGKTRVERFLYVTFLWYSLFPPHGNRRMLYLHLKPTSEDCDRIFISLSWKLKVIDNGVWLNSEKSKVKRYKENLRG